MSDSAKLSLPAIRPVEPVSAISGSMALCIGAHNPRSGADSFFAILVAQVP